MKKRYKIFTQEDFAKLLGGLSQPRVSRLLNGQEMISWPLASRLARLFPELDTDGWKTAHSDRLVSLFERLADEAKRSE